MKGLLTFLTLLVVFPLILVYGIGILLLNPVLAGVIAVCITAVIITKILKS